MKSQAPGNAGGQIFGLREDEVHALTDHKLEAVPDWAISDERLLEFAQDKSVQEFFRARRPMLRRVLDGPLGILPMETVQSDYPL